MKCGGAGCHDSGTSPNFLGGNDKYASIMQHKTTVLGNFNPAAAKILTYGVNNAHAGRTRYTDGDQTAIRNWLQQEAAAVGGTGGDGEERPPVVGASLAAFAQCMNQADFDTSNMQDWANKGTTGPNSQCVACHNITEVPGTAGFAPRLVSVNGLAVSQDNAKMFALNVAEPWTMFHHNAITDTVEISLGKFLRYGGRDNPSHPNFQMGENNRHRQYLQQFYDLTMQRMRTGNCPPNNGSTAYITTPPIAGQPIPDLYPVTGGGFGGGCQATGAAHGALWLVLAAAFAVRRRRSVG